MVPVNQLGICEEAAEQYECTKIFEIKKVFQNISFHEHSVAIDFGSGKGKMLFFLANYKNVNKVYGIELSELLVSISRQNMAKLGVNNVEILHLDVTDTPDFILDECNIFYFYNPFPRDVFCNVFRKIEVSLKRRWRFVYLIYFNPVCSDIIDNSQLFKKQASYSNLISFAETVVYRSISALA